MDYTDNRSKDQIFSDQKTLDASLWNLQIIGEASKHITDQTKQKHPNVDWHNIRGLRNTITHEYFGIDTNIVWDVVKEHIPKLKEQLKQIKDVER